MEVELKTEAFLEQGMGGPDWTLYDSSKSGYEGLITLKDGDYLHIPGKFKGYIKKHPPNFYVGWTQYGWSKKDWSALFWKEHTAFYREGRDTVIYTPEFDYYKILKY